MPRDVSYLDIAAALSERLTRARPGDRVESEHELAAAHGVSRPTARAALQQLEHRFLVRRVRGAGTFVNRRVDYVVGAHVPPSGTETFARAGVSARTTVVDARTVRASGDVARRLKVVAGDRVVRLVRLTRIDGVTAVRSTTRLPAALVPGLTDHLTDDVSLFHLFCGHYAMAPVRAWSRASLELPGDDVAHQLELDGIGPTWLVESVNRDGRAGTPIEFTTTWLRADLVRVVYEMEDPADDR